MARRTLDSFATRDTLTVGGVAYEIRSLERLEKAGFRVHRLPFCLKILLESLLRNEDGLRVEAAHVEALASWDPKRPSDREIPFQPARVLLQDFTGVPAVVDLAAMRDAMAAMGGDPKRINPSIPCELVIDHSVQVDVFGRPDAFQRNAELEFQRNLERYAFLRWGQKAFENFRVVPPDTGIVHQVNIEYLARVVFDGQEEGRRLAYPDTLVGTDSHTTMVNGLGVLGWGVGGIEAEAAMLGQPMSLLVPEVVGFRLVGRLPEGATATDLVLTVTQMLRKKGVVGKFVEFFGDGVASLSVADRATLGNMSPEFGCTCAMFPIDEETLEYLRFTGRPPERVALVEAYAKAQGLFRSADSPLPEYSETLELDLSTVVPSLAGPRRPHDRVPLSEAKRAFQESLGEFLRAAGASAEANVEVPLRELQPWTAKPPAETVRLGHGSVVIAAITSCTNTSNPSVMIGAGLLAKRAVERGLETKPWVKTSLAPGSKVVTDYLRESGLLEPLERLGFHLVGYGCTTCIGNSGPLPEAVAGAIQRGNLVAVAVLSGNRNFEGRINPLVRANYLASPPLVVAYALAGRIDVDLVREPLGRDRDGRDVFLKDLWPSPEEIRDTIRRAVKTEMFRRQYADVFSGDERWRALSVPEGARFQWDPSSTYVRRATFFDDLPPEPLPLADLQGARVLVKLGDSVTTDHISPAGSIAKESPAGRYLIERGVDPKDFNSYGARRGNHEVMVRGTFANIRLRNELVPGVEGGFTRHFPDGERTTIYDAAMRYRQEGVPLLVIAGKEYGSGSSRDWAAKGTFLLGIRAVLAESFERIHRSNLVGMGVLPLEFLPGDTRETLGLTGEEVYSISGIAEGLRPRARLRVVARSEAGEKRFEVVARIDTPVELEYYRHGGILQYVLRQLR
jgi:aconitate hydratase